MSDKFSTINQRASYAVGLQMGQQLAQRPFDGMDHDAVLEGVADALHSRDLQVSESDLNAAVDDLNRRLKEQQEQESREQSSAGEEFLKQNAERAAITETDSGLQYEILEQGIGVRPDKESTVKVHYHGTLIDGTVFDSSVQRGEPIEFPVTGVIPGWTEALQLMNTGSKYKLYIPHQLAYGERGAGGVIGPYQALVFEVELLEVK